MSVRHTQGSSHLAAEIDEQPAALRRLMAAEAGPVSQLAALLRGRADVSTVMLAARGSSDNAARYAQYLFGAFNALPVALAAPSLFTRYHRPPRLDTAVAIAVSQSGRSPDVIEVLAEANAQGRPTVAVTNDDRSALAREADTVVALHAGEERSVAATKTYVTSLAALALLSVALDGDDAAGRTGELSAAAGALEQVVADATADLGVPQWLSTAPSCAVIGRGFNYATAFEIALKIKELTGVIAQPYSSADFLHGPIAAADEGFPVVLVAPSGAVFEDMAALVAPLRDRGARLAVISDDDDLLGRADAAIPLPAVPEWVSPMLAVVPGQVLAWRLAERLGLDVDHPRGLRKATETR